MEGRKLLLLQQAVDDLGANIVLVVAEDVAVYKLLRATRDIVFVLEETVPAARDEVEPASEGIVDQLVGGACLLDDRSQLWVPGYRLVKTNIYRANSRRLTLPKLLLRLHRRCDIVICVRHDSGSVHSWSL